MLVPETYSNLQITRQRKKKVLLMHNRAKKNYIKIKCYLHLDILYMWSAYQEHIPCTSI